MANTNCLEGIKCPDCGNEDTFLIAGKSMFTVTDDGTEDHGDVEWDEDSYAECTECRRSGTLKDFEQASLQAVPETKPFDQVAAIMAYEAGELDESGTKDLFQDLVNTGLAWQLQGHYGRTAQALIEGGHIVPPDSGLKRRSPSEIAADRGTYSPEPESGHDNGYGR